MKNVLKQWKVELKQSKFVYEDGMFMYKPSTSGWIQFGVSVRKNSYAPTFQVTPTILLRNPLIDDSKPEVLLMGHLRPDGIYLHMDKSSWWAENELAGPALQALTTYAIPWFRKTRDAGYLCDVLEAAIREEESIVQIIEPMDEASTALPWPPPAARRVGSATYYRSAVLHYLNGHREMAIHRTKDWLTALAPNALERTKASAQLERLTTN